MGKLILIRHGETDKNVKGNIHSPNDPEELNSRGVEQMKHVSERLLDFGVDTIYSSNQLRAIQSGEILAKSLGLSLNIVEGMRERQWGDFAGRPWLEVEQLLQEMTVDQRYIYSPPQGESWKEFEERLVLALGGILRESADKTVVVVTHGGAIRALMPYLLGRPKDESFKHMPKNASLTVFGFDGKVFNEKLINDVRHYE